MLNNKVLFLASAILLLTACKNEIKQPIKRVETSRVTSLPYYDDPTFTPRWIRPGSDELKTFHAIPDFKLVNQLGDTITNKTFDNKIYVTDFFFTSCPGICPKMTTNMAKIQQAFEDDADVLLLSHSVTPKYDQVPVLRAYANVKGIIDSKWHLVTGDRTHIYDLGRNFYFVEEDLGREKAPDDFLHTDNFILVDKNKHIRGIYSGIHNASIQQLITDIKSLKKEL
jgi:protein SCO1/2